MVTALALLLGAIGAAVVMLGGRHVAVPSPSAARAMTTNTAAPASPALGRPAPATGGQHVTSPAPVSSFNPQQALLTAADLGAGYTATSLPPIGVGTLQTCGVPDLVGATRATSGHAFINAGEVSSALSSVTVFAAGTARAWLDQYVALARRCPTFSMGADSATITVLDGVNLADQTVRIEFGGSGEANSFAGASILVRHGDTIATIELDNYSGDAVAQLDRLGAIAAQRMAGAP